MPNARRGVGGADRDVRELRAVGLGVDRAVAVDEHAVGEAHEEDARDDRHAGAGLDEFERRADRVAGRVGRAGDHAVGVAQVHHHRAEVGGVAERVVGRAPRSSPCACAARGRPRRSARAGASSGDRRSPRRPGRGRARRRGRAPPRCRPSIVSAATPRRSRMSAARSTRSSSPSGSTMCRRAALASLDQLVLEHRRASSARVAPP